MKQQTEQKSVDFSEAVGGGWYMIVLQNKYYLLPAVCRLRIYI